MSVVRISYGVFDADMREQVHAVLVRGEPALRAALRRLSGLQHYYAALDGERNAFTNVSVWDTREEARQMDTLAEMLAQRPQLEALGVRFQPITNHEVVWQIEDAAGER